MGNGLTDRLWGCQVVDLQRQGGDIVPFQVIFLLQLNDEEIFYRSGQFDGIRIMRVMCQSALPDPAPG